MRQDYQQFADRDTEVIAVAPDTMGNASRYFESNKLPFVGLVDDTHAVYDLYDVQSRKRSLGQRPGLFVIDKAGIVRYAYLGLQQWEIPTNEEVLQQLDSMATD